MMGTIQSRFEPVELAPYRAGGAERFRSTMIDPASLAGRGTVAMHEVEALSTLSQLREAHEKVLAGIQELEDATREPAPDASGLAAVRWRLSKASGQRRKLVEEACERLLVDASPAVARQIAALRDNNAEMLAATTRHVGIWTIDQILADWEGYRAASAAMRRSMRARIATEQGVLYPLLGV